MRIGDIVRVHKKENTQIGIIIRAPKKMFMAPDDIAIVMIDGKIQHIAKALIEVLSLKNRT